MAEPAPDDRDSRSDLELIDAINRAETDAFEALYERHRQWVVNLARRFTGDEHIAVDVLQETFIYLLGKFPGFELTAKMTTFLYPVVRNASINQLRRRRRFVGPGDALLAFAAPPVSDASDRADRLRTLSAALDRLSPDHREVLLMRLLDGMSVPEVAEALDIPEGTVKSRLHHAVARLRADPDASTYFQGE